jgi:sigma-B regulation protein RsbU (phosphoserine phosphatase)
MATMALDINNGTDTRLPRILIADDQPDVLEALRLLLKGHGYSTESVTSPSALIDSLAKKEFDVILMDLNYARDTTSGREGLDLLAQLQANESTPPIVVMTGWASVGLAVEAMQHGVGDFVEKPWANVRLLEILKKQIEAGRKKRAAKKQAMEKSHALDEAALQLQRREREVEEARAIQQGFLPQEIPQIPGYQIYGAWQPARIVGGDYYDVLPFDDDSVGLCIADVAGKGMPAALLMSNFQASVRGFASPSLSPDALCEKLNALVNRNIAADRFITFFYAHLDGPSRRLSYANAGHNTPIVLHRDGSHRRLDQGGTVLGVFKKQSFEAETIDLAHGDRVVLFTDGVTEAHDRDGEEFGDSRLLEVLQDSRDVDSQTAQEKIFSSVAQFCGGNWEDDATLIVLSVE